MSRPPRIDGFSYLGRSCYSITTCTAQRRQVFRDPSLVELVLSYLRETATRERFAVLAYCFMPDHLHVVVVGLTASADLRRFMTLVKQRAGFVVAKRYGIKLWQEGYHDHVLRRDRSLARLVQYVLENPIRAGLAETVESYPFSGWDPEKIASIL